jgi:transposase
MGCHQADAAEQTARCTTGERRRVLNGIFGCCRSGAAWRDLPGSFDGGGRAA